MKNTWEILPFSHIAPRILKDNFLDLTAKFLISHSILPSEDIYPGISVWFDKVKQEAIDTPNQREIFLVITNEGAILKIIAILIVKNKDEEKKICTIRVDERYRKQGIGTALFAKAFEYLDTRMPLITVSEECCPCLKYLLNKYNFKETSRRLNMYRTGKIEYIYNENIVID
ncbi:ribosomal-protein-alanine acetyltransferase [[Pasteurella] aerogenes]|nr:ribosomal-protein-alanine acetyltransferase [[Pasteurella] aerogenes]